VVSVDTKKKELIGDFKNGGREWRRRGKPLISHEVIVQLIANTTTAIGLKIRRRSIPIAIRQARRSPTPNSNACTGLQPPFMATGTMSSRRDDWQPLLMYES